MRISRDPFLADARPGYEGVAMTRRRFLQALLLGLLSRGGAVAQQPASTSLSSLETENLLAFAEVIVEGRTLSSIERGYLADHLEDAVQRVAGLLGQYRLAARLLDALAGKRFASLTFSERNRLVEVFRLDARNVLPPGADPVRSQAEARLVRARVVPNLIAGYWASPAGWSAVGYATFPGRCGDLTRYTRSEP